MTRGHWLGRSMNQAVPMPHRGRIHSGTRPKHGPPRPHPPCRASTPAVTCGALPAVTAAARVHSTLHRTPVSRVYVACGSWLRQWWADFCLGGGGPKGGGGLWAPPPRDPELFEAPKAPNNFFWPKLTCTEGTRKIFHWPKTRRKICPIT